MGTMIAGLLDVFAETSPDPRSNRAVWELASDPTSWLAGHAVFDEVHRRLLAAKDERWQWQYCFEESCCQALFNAAEPPDPFDAGSAFFVVPHALSFAQAVGVSVERVAAVVSR